MKASVSAARTLDQGNVLELIPGDNVTVQVSQYVLVQAMHHF
jgi:hypothetical protein